MSEEYTTQQVPTGAPSAPGTYRKLLIPVDDTDDSETALVWLQNHLHRNGRDELHFMHVVPFSASDFAAAYGVPPVDYMPAADSSQNWGISAAEKFIYRRFVMRLPEDVTPRPIVHIVKSETSLQHIGELICHKAAELGVAAVVMSTHNKGRIKEFLLGSVTNHCLHHSSMPLIVVPPAWRPE